jgi:hypothetical protein
MGSTELARSWAELTRRYVFAYLRMRMRNKSTSVVTGRIHEFLRRHVLARWQSPFATLVPESPKLKMRQIAVGWDGSKGGYAVHWGALM